MYPLFNNNPLVTLLFVLKELADQPAFVPDKFPLFYLLVNISPQALNSSLEAVAFCPFLCGVVQPHIEFSEEYLLASTYHWVSMFAGTMYFMRNNAFVICSYLFPA